MANSANRIDFLHGFLGSARDWDPIVRELKSPVKKHVIDLQPADGWRAGIHSVANQIDTNTVVVGYSMGARIALAVTFEKQLSGLVFVSGSPGLESDADRTRRLEHDLRISQRLEQIDDSVVPEFLSEWYRQSVFESLSESQIEYLVAYRQTLDRDRQSRLLRTFSVANQPDFWPRLHELHDNPRLKTPVLVVAGERDTKYVDIAHRFKRLCPSASISIVSNAGHNVPREQPEKFCQILDDFIGAQQ